MDLIRKQPIAGFLLISLMMALIYTQLPLYSSNQHQYFLHGMAQAGLGSLDEDWLSTTREPTPLFTLLVRLTFQVLKSPLWFYVIYALLMGAYGWSLLDILDNTLGIGRSLTHLLVTVTFFLTVHSAALRYLMGNWLGANWAFLFDGGLAGQRLLGTVLQPSAFGVLLLAAIALYLRGYPIWAAILAALAACIHPTYLFTAGLLVAGFMVQTYLEDHKVQRPLLIGASGLVVVAPILIYTLIHFVGGEEAAYAQSILTEVRLPHHTLASQWFDVPALIKVVMIVAALAVVQDQKRLFIPLCVVFCGSFLLSVYQVTSGNLFLALLFPWRPSTLLVPLASSILVSKLAICLVDRIQTRAWVSNPLIHVLCAVLIASLMVAGVYRMQAAAREQQMSNQSGMLEWVREHSAAGDRYLIPVNLERFRTATLRPVYVDFFAIPYRASDVVTWYHRMLAVNRFYASGDCMELYHLAYDDDLNHVVAERSAKHLDCPGLVPIFQDDYFVVYRYDRK